MRYERFDGRLERIRAPDLLKLSRSLAVAAPGIVAALAADQLVHLGAAVIRPAAEVTGGRFRRQSVHSPPGSSLTVTSASLATGSGRASPKETRDTAPVGSPSPADDPKAKPPVNDVDPAGSPPLPPSEVNVQLGQPLLP